MANEWRVCARKMLSQGFGVEDISVSLGVDVDSVRQLVRALRNSGRLSDVLFGHRYKGPIDAKTS